MKSFFILCFFICQFQIVKNEPPVVCAKGLIETYGIQSYLMPKPMSLYLCPEINLSCCSIFDQFKMYKKWNTLIKPQLEEYYTGITLKFENMKYLIKKFFKIKMKPLIKKLNTNNDLKERITKKYLFLRQLDLPGILDDLIDQQTQNSKFLISARKQFFCTVCNFENHKFFDLEEKTVQISLRTCENLAMNTLSYVVKLNSIFNKQLQDFYRLITNFTEDETEIPIFIQDFDHVLKSVKACSDANRRGLKANLQKCMAYCRAFNINTNSPVYEGYSEYYNHFINHIYKFLQTYGSHLLDNRRVLEDQEKIQQKRILEQKQMTDQERKDLELQQINLINDPYIEYQDNKNVSELALHGVTVTQEKYKNTKEKGLENFINDKLYYIDSEIDFDEIPKERYIKIIQPQQVDLENFETVINVSGILIRDIGTDSPYDQSIYKLIHHLKNTAHYKIHFEKFDPNLVNAMNDLTDNDVAEFHRDNFMTFVNYGFKLSKRQLLPLIANKRALLKKGFIIN